MADNSKKISEKKTLEAPPRAKKRKRSPSKGRRPSWLSESETEVGRRPKVAQGGWMVRGQDAPAPGSTSRNCQNKKISRYACDGNYTVGAAEAVTPAGEATRGTGVATAVTQPPGGATGKPTALW